MIAGLSEAAANLLASAASAMLRHLARHGCSWDFGLTWGSVDALNLRQ